MKKPRKHYAAVEKVAILRRHLLERVPVSDLCDQYHIQPSMFYNWQKQFFENGAAAFEQPRSAPEKHQERRIAALQDKIQAQKRGRGRAAGGARQTKKSTWGALTGAWVPHDIRDQVVDYVRYWSDRTEIPTKQLVQWIGLSQSKFYDWRKRYGKVNEHNGWIPRDWWLEDWEKQAIVEFHYKNPLEGYRRLTFMMLDADVVAASPSSVYRVLSDAGLMKHHNTKASKKGTGFQQPLGPHEHWHVDIAYINVGGTFFFLCSLLDGYSRSIVHWEIRPKMEESDVETIIQRARECYPGVSPRIISDNGPQFIASRLQGVYSHMRYHACDNFALLSPKQWQDYNWLVRTSPFRQSLGRSFSGLRSEGRTRRNSFARRGRLTRFGLLAGPMKIGIPGV